MAVRFTNYKWLYPYLLKQPKRLKTSVAQDHQTIEASTIHKENLKLFSDIKIKEWWDPKGPVAALHTLNTLRVPFILNAFTSQNKNCSEQKILDIGCGGGILSEALGKIGFKVTGVDASEELISIAQKHSQMETSLKNKPSYVCTTIEEHVQEYSNYYDGVVASEVIEHVNNKELFVKACIQALKPGGRIIVSTPNKTILSLLINLWVAEYVLNVMPKGTHSYDMLISVEDLKTLLKKYNCDIEACQGYFINLLTKTWHKTKSLQSFYMLQAVKRI